MIKSRWQLGLAFGLALFSASPARPADRIVIGTVPNVGDGPLICAIERGYFRDVDIETEIAPFRTASDMTPLMARGDLAMMGGGVSVSYFNSVARGMPLRYFVNRARAPVWHGLVLRAGLAEKVKSARDLKGLRFGISAVGGLSEYELGKTLESAGLSLDDVETTALGMAEAAIAVGSGAIDGGVFAPPFDTAAAKKGGSLLLYADDAVKPRMEVSGLIYNVDWAARNAAVLDRFTIAYLRGARCYLEAARAGANRAEMIDWFVKYSPIKDSSIFADMKWSELDPDGRVALDSLMDQQDFYARRGYLTTRANAAALVDPGPVERALSKLGPWRN